MGKKQTAVEWLMEWIIEESQVIPVDPGDVYQKAKELLAMEKEQIKKAYQGNWPEILSDESEEYYNETYGKE